VAHEIPRISRGISSPDPLASAGTGIISFIKGLMGISNLFAVTGLHYNLQDEKVISFFQQQILKF
jgi:hypothetical protein